MDFCTFGMFILDDIYYPPSSNLPPSKSVVGGAGSYAALGARLLSPPPLSKQIGWVVDLGIDFPDEVLAEIKGWETSVLLRDPVDGRKTTRGWNGYETVGGERVKAFKYLTEKKRVGVEDLPEAFVTSKGFHMVCSAHRCKTIVNGLMEKRLKAGLESSSDSKALMVWEPIPDLCNAEELESIQDAMIGVDVISPNHLELGNLLGRDDMVENGNVNERAVQEGAKDLLGRLRSRDECPTVIVRAGARGCFAFVPGREGGQMWIPAYHHDSSRVIDPTGGGNCFLGALVVAMVRSESTGMSRIISASVQASVAASFAIEQIGLPKLGTGELWNGESVAQRWREVEDRLV
ncbi:MAG: hypothetical protein M1814_003679 [Vezdaea aestivalis]|nr:MAG: hypothetical protein M1814_003679 [Vezdaea aestivalis]